MSIFRHFRAVFREPLLHFIVLGGIVFAVLASLVPADEGTRRIVVNDDILSVYLQYRNKAFQPGRARQYLEAMSDDERQKLAGDFVREEVLYREAERLGLAESDYMIRMRMVQKMEFALQDFAAASVDADDRQLREFYQANQDRYYEPGRFSFTHVFVSSEHLGDEALDKALALRERLNSDNVAFGEAGQFGDRFPYHRNYVDRSADDIAGHFGQAFVDQLSKLEVDAGQQGARWSPPLRSEYGYHLVLLTNRVEPRLPGFAELRERLRADYRKQQAVTAQQQAITALINRYERVEG